MFTLALRPDRLVVLQMLESPTVAIFNQLVPAAPSTDDLTGALASGVYRVLPVMKDASREWVGTGLAAPLQADVPVYFSRDPKDVYMLWYPEDFTPRVVPRDECRGLEVMAVWDHDNFIRRLRAHFFEGGYLPPERERVD